MTVVSMNNLLEAGVHFGHPTKRWNPKMKEYIYGEKNDSYIIDLQKTAKLVEDAYAALYEIAKNGGKVLFVGTRRQAQEACKEEALRSESYYVTERWLGGTLTNFKTIRRRVKRLEQIETMEKDGTFEKLPKKEVIGIKKEYEKLNKILCGIRNMDKLPQAMYIVDPSKEEIAIREAKRLHIPVFGIVDTNCDPDSLDYVIPSNDEAIRAVKLITGVLANAIVEANGGKVVDYSINEKDNSTKPEDFMKKAIESIRPREQREPREDRPFRKNFKRDFKKDFKKDFRKEFKKDNEEPKKEFKKEEVKIEPKVEVKKEAKVEPKVEVKEEAKVEPKAVVKKAVDLSSKTVAELRDLAKIKEIKGYSTMKKAELLEALK